MARNEEVPLEIGRYYAKCPKKPETNADWRQKLLALAGKDARLQKELILKSSRDPLFWINTFCWTLNPKKLRGSQRPMVLYGYQVEAIEQIVWCIEHGENLVIEKSREMGATWISMQVFMWYMWFRPMLSFLAVHRKEDMVDNRNNYSALFPKVDYMHKMLPRWMQDPLWKKGRQKLHLECSMTGSTFDGETTTGMADLGGRRTAAFVDEVTSLRPSMSHDLNQSLHSVTNTNLFNGTPRAFATENVQYRLKIGGSTKIVSMHWSRHPEYRKGLYTWTKDGELKVLDEKYQFPEGYVFREVKKAGQLRSVHYDSMDDRLAGDQVRLAQEWDIDYLAARSSPFDLQLVEENIDRYACYPMHEGRLVFEKDQCEPIRFEDEPGGSLRMWVPIPDGWPTRPYNAVLGVDVSNGTGASNSVISIGDLDTGEKIGEYADPHISPNKLAQVAISLARWLRGHQYQRGGSGAMIKWEAPGPGRNFGQEVMNVGYWNLYYHRDSKSPATHQRKTPGWWPTEQTKTEVLQELNNAYRNFSFRNPSEQSLRECLEYSWGPGGKLIHAKVAGSQDVTGARESHGDRVIADALVWDEIKMRRANRVQDSAMDESLSLDKCPPESFGWRRLRHKRSQKDKYYQRAG